MSKISPWDEFFKSRKESESESKEVQDKLASIFETRTKNDDSLMVLPNVLGVGTGYKVKAGRPIKELSVVAFVEKKIPERNLSKHDIVPKEIDGILTDVVETGKIETHLLTGRVRPARPGFSIGHRNITAGTFGCLAKKDHEYMILSNNHVLANGNLGAIGDPILQPGTADGGTDPTDMVARLSSFVPLVKNYNLVDVALAKPTDSRFIRPDAVFLGIPRGVGQPILGTIVVKAGRTTQFSIGIIIATDVTITVSGYPVMGSATFRDQFLTTGMSAGGDSGSLTRDLSGRAVGLLFAGSAVVTVHNNINNVLIALGVDLVTV